MRKWLFFVGKDTIMGGRGGGGVGWTGIWFSSGGKSWDSICCCLPGKNNSFDQLSSVNESHIQHTNNLCVVS